MNAVARLEAALEACAGPRGHAWILCGMAAVACLGLVPRLDASPVTRSSESRCFQVAQNMRESGDWLVPVLDGQVRLQKPPLCYWTVAASGMVLGETSRLALRLPAAAAALGLLAIVYAWGRSRGGRPEGILAAAGLLMMLQFWILGRRGDAEMPLAFFATAALFAFDRIYWGGRRDLLSWFFAAVLFAFLAKATVPLLVIGMPITLRLAADRALGRLLCRDVLIRGLVCGIGCLGWYLAILLWVPGAVHMLLESALLPLGLAKSVDSTVHARPFWFFLAQLVAAAAPAILLAPLVPWHLRRRAADPDAHRQSFPALAFASLFIAFSLIPGKQKHYLLPLLPLLALSIAPALRAAYQDHRDVLERAARYAGWLLLTCSPLAALAVAVHSTVSGEPAVATAAISLSLLLVGLLGFLASRCGNLRVLGASLVGVTFVLFAVYVSSVMPLRDGFAHADALSDPQPDAERWSRTFERYPALRVLYGASDWHPAAATRRSRSSAHGLGARLRSFQTCSLG